MQVFAAAAEVLYKNMWIDELFPTAAAVFREKNPFILVQRNLADFVEHYTKVK